MIDIFKARWYENMIHLTFLPNKKKYDKKDVILNTINISIGIYEMGRIVASGVLIRSTFVTEKIKRRVWHHNLIN